MPEMNGKLAKQSCIHIGIHTYAGLSAFASNFYYYIYEKSEEKNLKNNNKKKLTLLYAGLALVEKQKPIAMIWRTAQRHMASISETKLRASKNKI